MDAEERKTEARSGKEFLVCVSLLPAIREKFASSFDLLEIPEVVRIDECAGRHGTVFFRNYDGKKYDNSWSEQTGGSDLGLELSSEMPRLIADFRKIDIGWVLGHPIGKRIGECAFDLPNWLKEFRDRKVIANDLGISDVELSNTEELVSGGFKSTERILSNGDFYPRNLIRLDTKFVVIDWDYRPGSRFCFIDYLPNVAAFAYIHMWNNKEWQKRFFDGVTALGIEVSDLRRAILIKAFEQAMYWRKEPSFWPSQVELFRNALQNNLHS
jgi:hypothetical protein